MISTVQRYTGRVRPGYSIIEISLVLVIIALLALVGLRTYNGIVRSVRTGNTTSLMRTVKAGIDMYKIHTTQYPRQLNDLIQRPADAQVRSKWQGPYVDSSLSEFRDGFDNPLVYRVNGQGAEHPYDLFSYGYEGEDAAPENWLNVWDI